jgi:hypothetical protein
VRGYLREGRIPVEVRVRRLLILTALIAVGCQRPVAPRTDDIAGDWLKLEKSMPPVNLTFTRTGSDLRARLRLSGRESFGTATLDGTHLRIKLDDQAEPLLGELLSDVELSLKLVSPTDDQRLHKQ